MIVENLVTAKCLLRSEVKEEPVFKRSDIRISCWRSFPLFYACYVSRYEF